jgi:hypothetical protein
MSSTGPHYNEDVPLHNQGPPGTKPYCIPEGGVLHVTASYPYKKLHTDHQFRLLKLFPKSYENPLTRMFGLAQSHYLYGTLSDHDLEEDVSYECLSYVWGAAEAGRVLWLDTYMLAISDNLDMALRCLQHKTEPRMIWVDFICINQDDLAERKQQVELMYRLYSKAEKVIAYLGDEADGSEHLPAFLERIEAAHFKDVKEKGEAKTKTIKPWNESDWVRLGLPSIDDAAWLALRNFILRPWFVRVWIMQEALAAKDLSVICGLWMAPATFIFQTIRIASARLLPFKPRVSEFGSVAANQISRAVAQFNLLMELGLCEIICNKDDSWTLIDILERSRHASCTDPRDRVFALLNISNDQPPLGLQPDYMGTVSETYKITARALVATGQGHRLLRNAWMSESALELPSWVPDWSLREVPFDAISPLATRFKKSGCFEAGGTENSIHLGENPDELIVNVFGIGNIHFMKKVFEYEEDPPPTPQGNDTEQTNITSEVASQTNPSPIDDASEANKPLEPTTQPSPPAEEEEPEIFDEKDWSKYPVLFRVFGVVQTYLQMSLSPLYKDKDTFEILWRTMICDRELGAQHKASPEFGSYFMSYVDHVKLMYGIVSPLDHVGRIQDKILSSPLGVLIQTSEQLLDLVRRVGFAEQEEATKFDIAARKFCHSMRVTITDTGVVGMVPRRAEKGDVVVVVKGVTVPLVLRRDRDGRFKVVGQAYFWGFMNGEVFEMQDMEEEEIVLI